jgi:nucleotide-binding universal stress UspA family protein
VDRAVEEEMAALLARFGDRAPPLRRAVAEGLPRDVLLAEVGRSRSDLLVLGRHGRTGVVHAFLGSVTEDLLRSAPCDVLVAKAW